MAEPFRPFEQSFPDGLVIRTERPDDADAIEEVVAAAFDRGAEALLVEHLRDVGALELSLVALRDGEVIGHVACSPVTIDAEEGLGWGVAPVSVRPDWQGQRVGHALMEAAIGRASDLGAKLLALVGDPGYYARFGFRAGPPNGWHWTDEPGLMAFQVLVLDPRSFGPAPHDVAYHVAFDGLE